MIAHPSQISVNSALAPNVGEPWASLRPQQVSFFRDLCVISANSAVKVFSSRPLRIPFAPFAVKSFSSRPSRLKLFERTHRNHSDQATSTNVWVVMAAKTCRFSLHARP